MKTEPSLLSKPGVSSPAAAGGDDQQSLPVASEVVDRVREFVHSTTTIEADNPEFSESAESMLEVAYTLIALKLDADCIVATLLQPLTMNTASVSEHIADYFSANVIKLIAELDRISALSVCVNANVTQGKSVSMDGLRKLLLTATRDIRVLIMQMVAVLQRLRALDEISPQRISPEQQHALAYEARDLYAPLANRLGIWQLKWELEDLALKQLEPNTYRQIAKQIKERRVDREHYIASVCKTLLQAMREAGINTEISGRPKHIFGIYAKMQRKSLKFDHVFDVRAVRILTDDKTQCYAALGVVHARWQYLREEFDDYIASPKANGYQSLHTAVIGPEGKTVEVQIRTRRMHELAELGVAAHWRYKENINRSGSDKDMEERIHWVRRILGSGDEFGGSADWLEQLQSEMVDDRIYVLTPNGEVKELPTGATVLDFAYLIHTDIGHRCRGARINGTMAPLTRALKNGDQVQVLTTRTIRPSQDWLNPHLGYLNTARARAKVRHWFRQQDRDQHIADGQALWNAEVRRLGVLVNDYEAACKRFNVRNVDELLVLLGRGDVSAAQLSNLLQTYLPAPEELPLRKARHKKRSSGYNMRIGGVESLMTHRSHCCKPLPSDPIVGYITRGRGISIHRADCRNVLAINEEDRAQRLIDVSWSDQEDSLYPVELALHSEDRRGVLSDISAVITNEKVNILSMDLTRNNADDTVTVRLSVEVRDYNQMSRLLVRLQQLPDVYDVCRTRS